MPAESARSTWTDERLDDFRGEVSGRFDRIDQRFDRLDDRFDRMDERIDALYRAILAVGGAMVASIFVGAAGIAATQL